jgi:hypothetical protein
MICLFFRFGSIADLFRNSHWWGKRVFSFDKVLLFCFKIPSWAKQEKRSLPMFASIEGNTKKNIGREE